MWNSVQCVIDAQRRTIYCCITCKLHIVLLGVSLITYTYIKLEHPIKTKRQITHTPTCSHSSPLFKQLQFLNISQIINLQVSFFMFDLLNNISPNTFEHMFLPKKHIIHTKHVIMRPLELLFIQIFIKILYLTMVHIWNNLSPELKLIKNKNKLKKLTKYNIINGKNS